MCVAPAEVANHVAAVAVFGNPSNRVKWAADGDQPAVRAKSIEMWNSRDPVCPNGSDVAAQSLHGEAGLYVSTLRATISSEDNNYIIA